MSKSFARVKGLGFILWHARHELYHALLGVAWAWVIREWWGEFNIKWILVSVFGSLVPDIEHLYYFIANRRHDGYALQVIRALREREWRLLTVFIEKGHKHNTNLAFHNIYVILFLFFVATVCVMFDWNSWVVLIGAMIIHYLFDIVDDIISLGYVNANWKRWGRAKKKLHPVKIPVKK
jgi:hypothetical protein